MIEAQGASLVYEDHGREVYACREVELSVGAKEFVGILLRVFNGNTEKQQDDKNENMPG